MQLITSKENKNILKYFKKSNKHLLSVEVFKFPLGNNASRHMAGEREFTKTATT